jgi:hypothetical protein
MEKKNRERLATTYRRGHRSQHRKGDTAPAGSTVSPGSDGRQHSCLYEIHIGCEERYRDRPTGRTNKEKDGKEPINYFDWWAFKTNVSTVDLGDYPNGGACSGFLQVRLLYPFVSWVLCEPEFTS